jgi:hypothetical protein
MTKRGDMNIDLAYPPGWVQLPVGISKKLERDKELDKWATGAAQEMLPGAPAEQVSERARQLSHLTVSCRARKDQTGLAFYPPSGEGLVAMLDVKSYVPDRRNPEITLDLLEEIYAKDSADTVGDIQTSRVDLPSGSAVRVRRKRIEEPDPTGHGILMEGVTYAIRPPGFDSAAVATMTWRALQLGDQLAAMADAIAKTIRVTSA